MTSSTETGLSMQVSSSPKRVLANSIQWGENLTA